MKVRGWSSLGLPFNKRLTEFKFSWRIYHGSTGNNTDKPSESQALETRHFWSHMKTRRKRQLRWRNDTRTKPKAVSHSENPRHQLWANFLLCPLQPSPAPLSSPIHGKVSLIHLRTSTMSESLLSNNCNFWSYKVKGTAQSSPDSNPVLGPSRNTKPEKCAGILDSLEK